MPVTLNVNDVRRNLIARMGPLTEEPKGKASTSFLGGKFHALFACLVDPDSPLNLRAYLVQRDSNAAALESDAVHFAYEQFVGPMLQKNIAQLQTASAEVEYFWEATRHLIGWLCELEQWAMDNNVQTSCQLLFSPEQPLECVVHRDEWTQPVRLVGVADALMFLPRSGKWGVLELKLGRQSHPEADLAQAALYHLMAENNASVDDASETSSPLAILRFAPALEETVFSGPALDEAKDRLIDLLGEMAGVLPMPPETPAEGLPSPTAPESRGFWNWLRALFGGSPALDAPVGQDREDRSSVTTPNVGADKDEEGEDAAPRPTIAPKSAEAMPASTQEEKHVPEETSANGKYQSLGRKLIETLHEYNVQAELDGPPIPGPTFVRFPVQPGAGVKINTVKKLCQEIQMRLGLDAWPLIHMVQGRLVIDIQRRDRQFIDFAAIESQIPATDPLLGSAQVPLGIDLEGRLHCLDLADPDCAHVLVAGTTGSGKSEWLKCAVAGLISRNAPEQLLFLIIDPKRNAFLWMQHTPYLYKPIVFPDEAPVAEALAALADEMDRRYALLEGAPSLAEWSRNTGTVLPRIVCVCDEYADLVCRGKAEREATESQIVRLGAKARAAGIHLMIATQQPSRKIVDGALDTNIPARIGLKMQRSIESRMVLSESGAELLLGKGDLLFKNINPPQRFQSAYLPDDQRDALMDKCASGFS